MAQKCGIYIIKNRINDRFYIGSSIDIKHRWQEHISSANSFSKYPIHNAIRKYSKNNFSFKILEICNKNDLLKKEQKWLDKKSNNILCYNIAKNAKAPMLGRKHTDKTKQKISLKKKYISEETRKLLGKSWRGKKQPRSMVEKRNKSNTGKKRSIESKNKIRKAAFKRYSNSGFLYPELINVKTGKIISSGINFRKMCRENNLKPGSMWKVVKDSKKSCLGWRINNG